MSAWALAFVVLVILVIAGALFMARENRRDMRDQRYSDYLATRANLSADMLVGYRAMYPDDEARKKWIEWKREDDARFVEWKQKEGYTDE